MTRTERQLQIIERWKECGGRGCAVCCTGFGKTRTALMLCDKLAKVNNNLNVLIVVPTKVLKEQWQQSISEYSFENIFAFDIMVLATAAKRKTKCDLLVLDELHTVSSPTALRLFENCSYKCVLGLTATYERLDEREKLLVDKLCPVCDTVTLKEALDNQWVAPHIKYKVLIDVDLTEYDKMNHAFLQHFSFFDFNFSTAMAVVSNKALQQKLAKEKNVSVNEVRTHAYAWSKALQGRKSFIANHPKKIEIAKRIIEARKDKKIITFNSSIQMCEEYGFGKIISSKQSKKVNKSIIEEFNNQSIGVLHTAKMCDAGVDIKGLSVGINAGYTSSQLVETQRNGRTCRFEPGKKAETFQLVIRNTVEEKWANKSLEGKEFIIIDELELEEVLKTGTINKEPRIQQVSKYNFRY